MDVTTYNSTRNGDHTVCWEMSRYKNNKLNYGRRRVFHTNQKNSPSPWLIVLCRTETNWDIGITLGKTIWTRDALQFLKSYTDRSNAFKILLFQQPTWNYGQNTRREGHYREPSYGQKRIKQGAHVKTHGKEFISKNEVKQESAIQKIWK